MNQAKLLEKTTVLLDLFAQYVEAKQIFSRLPVGHSERSLELQDKMDTIKKQTAAVLRDLLKD